MGDNKSVAMEIDLFKRGASKTCVFGDCYNDSRYTAGCTFIAFPKPCLAVRRGLQEADKKHVRECILCEKSKLWLSKCKRKDYCEFNHIKKWHYLCTQHFVNLIGPTETNPYPLPVAEAFSKRKSNLEDQVRKSRTCNAVPSIACPVSSKRRKTESFLVSPHAVKSMSVGLQTTAVNVCIGSAPQFTPSLMEHHNAPLQVEEKTLASPKISVMRNSSTQTTFCWKSAEHFEKKMKELKETNNSLRKEIAQLKKKENNKKVYGSGEKMCSFVESLKNDDKKCRFYTSLTFNSLIALFTFLSPLDNLHYWGTSKAATSQTCKRKFTHFEELVIMLVRLRTGLLLEDLKYRFNVSTALLSRIIITWVQHCYSKFNLLRPMMMPSRDKIKKHLPPIFKSLKNIRVIIDCAEFYCQNPSNLEQQSNLYSAYKATTTYKVLLGCTPNGAISFVSELFEGSISDKELVKRSKLLDLLDEGDLILADRGFTIQEETSKKHISLNIPPFLKGRDRLTAEEEIATKRIAKQRIYIEHVVGHVKKFRLLKKILPLSMRGILSQVVFVCACLVNFQPVILKE